MRKSIKLTFWMLLLGVIFLVQGVVSAQEAPVSIRLLSDKTSYQPGEPIRMQVDVIGDSFLARKGFSARDRRLLITITGPDGNVIRCKYLRSSDEPGPPYRFEERDAAFAEYFEASTVVLEDAGEFYEFVQNGLYTAQVFESPEAFAESDIDDAGNLIAYLDSATAYSVASNKIYFEIVPLEPLAESSIQVKAKLITIGSGWWPSKSITPLEGINVRLIPISAISEDYYPIDYKTYPIIWEFTEPLMTATTDSNGIANFEGADQNDYLILGYYPEGEHFNYLARRVRAGDPRWDLDWPIKKRLVAFETSDGNRIACRIFRFTGSELLIYEPEFVTWDSDQELYPFVFESEGDWEVETSVSPPEGFVADKKSLTAETNNDMQAVQFTITDRGSSWKETQSTFKFKNKKEKKTKKLVSKIGVKLEKNYAKEKGKKIYGDTEVPGPFKGGKKIKEDKDKDKNKDKNKDK